MATRFFSFRIFFILFSLIIINSCKTTKETLTGKEQIINLDTIDVNANLYKRYNPSETKKNDLLHTKLKVKFDWDKSYLYGQATLTLKPYFYSTDQVELDAKGFDIHEVSLLTDTGKTLLDYTYGSNDSITNEEGILTITLDKEYTRKDTFRIYIDYTAKPNELNLKGSNAITDRKGLYFINPDGKEKDKPRQIWTQGETEANSCWFPTIDSPNERMTQEIYITVDTNFVTLSNGLLIYSADNGDGTRTDYWNQELPHAPYLAMMAIGEYSIVTDKWRDIEVNYYVEPEFEKHAKMIFGNTPEMLEFYSNIFGVDYPWEKYSQVVVNDFVSGAMENTTAVVHGEFIQRDEREYLDKTGDDIIAHELVHHWFGNLVTCESWANLPLNESFGTYGEYLWKAYKYGLDEADHHIQNDLESYLWASTRGKFDLIRFDYIEREDMFDSHSYAKGGRVLHMLRKYVGDEAFFESLKYYLLVNKFSTVEIHDLRIAFEKTTGEDLNWFFNQWFMNSGHPELIINYRYDDSLKQQTVSVKQVQDFRTTPLYKLPVKIDIYSNGNKEQHEVVIDEGYEEFVFDVSTKPGLVNFDAEKMLLCVKVEEKSNEEWAFQYYNAPLYMDRYEAIEALGKTNNDSAVAKVITKCLDDKYWDLRILAMRNLQEVDDKLERIRKDVEKNIVMKKLIAMAQKDNKSKVRANAIKYLSKYFTSSGEDNIDLLDIYRNAANDSAYSVAREGLQALAKENHEEAIEIAKSFEDQTSNAMVMTIVEIYSEFGNEEQYEFFQKAYKKVNSYEKYSFVDLLGDYLLRQNDATINKGLAMLEDVAKNHKTWWIRLTAVFKIKKLSELYDLREKTIIEDIKINKNDFVVVQELETQLSKIKDQQEHILNLLTEIKKAEEDSNVLRFFED